MTEEAKAELSEAQIEEAATAEFNNQAGINPENQPAEGETADEKKITEPNPDQTPDGLDHSKQGKVAGEEDEEDPEKKPDEEDGKKKTRIQQILEDRNQAREEASDEKQKNAKKDTEIEELKTRLKKIEDGKVEDGGEPAKKGNPAESAIEKTIRKVTQDELAKDRKIRDSEKADSADVAKVIADNPDAEGLKGDIENAMKIHPTLSAIGAYRMVKSASDEDGGNTEETKTNKTSKLKTGARSKGSLSKNKKMTTDDMESHLRKEQADGNLVL